MSIIEKINTGYKVWNINEKDFPVSGSMEDKIKFLLNYAALAPSSHNTQPWKFKVNKNELEIRPDFSRYLSESDKDYRMIYISLGCALANILVAAEHFNLNYEIVWNNEIKVGAFLSVLKIIFHLTPAVKPLGLGDGTPSTVNIANLFESIKNRRTNRNFYKNILVMEKHLEEFKKLNIFEEIKIDFVSDDVTKEKIAEIMGEGMKRIMSQRLFRRELAAWLRTNLTLKRDGMPGNGHKMNLFTSIIAPHILRNIDVSEVEREKAIKRVLNFPALGVISSKEDNVLSFIYAGEILEKLSLVIKSRGMDIAIMVAIIEDKESRAKLKNALKLNFLPPISDFAPLNNGNFRQSGIGRKVKQSAFLPQMFFGFGYAESPAPKSPRRDLKEFL